MIVTELLKDDTLVKHYSDKDMMLRQIESGMLFYHAIDVVPCRFSYEETNIKIHE